MINNTQYQNFLKWLELNTDLSEKSINNYVRGIERITKDLCKLKIIQKSLEEIKDGKELRTIMNNYFSISEYKELNRRGNNMYTASFNHFISYRENQGSKPVGNSGIVYIISNPAIPGLVKIGKTINLEQRMASLYNSSIPVPFRCLYAKKVENYSKVERNLHAGLNSIRENPNREFFRIAEDEVINFLEMMPGEDVTPREDVFEDKEDQTAFEKTTRIGQRFNLEMIGITPGSTLQFLRDENITCKVLSKTRVEFEGKDHSLSSAALKATNDMGFNWKTIAGPLHWKYEGEILDERRKRYESGEE